MEEETITTEAPAGDAPAEDSVEPQAQPQKVHEPAVDSPRWKEVYWKLKETEKKSTEQDEINRVLVEHNKALAKSLETIETKVFATERPDPIEDPDGFTEWTVAEAEKRVNKKLTESQGATKKPAENTRFVVMEQVVSGMHDDYYDVIESIKPDMTRDAALRNQIWGSNNPFKAAYDYGLKKKAGANTLRDQGYVERGTIPPSKTGPRRLSPEQKKVQQALGVGEADYIKQLDIIEKQRGANA